MTRLRLPLSEQTVQSLKENAFKENKSLQEFLAELIIKGYQCRNLGLSQIN